MFGLLGRAKAHRFCQDNLSAYLDGQLTAREQRQVRRHLEVCQACRDDLRALQRTVELVRHLPAVQAPRSFAIPLNVQPSRTPLWMRSWVYNGMRAATVLATVLLVIALAGNALSLPPAFNAPLPAAATMMAGREAEPQAPSTATMAGATAPATGGVANDQALGAGAASTAQDEVTEMPAAAPTSEGEMGIAAAPADTAAASSAPAATAAPLPKEPAAGQPSADEIARMTAAPLGKGGGTEMPTLPGTEGTPAQPEGPAAQIASVPITATATVTGPVTVTPAMPITATETITPSQEAAELAQTTTPPLPEATATVAPPPTEVARAEPRQAPPSPAAPVKPQALAPTVEPTAEAGAQTLQAAPAPVEPAALPSEPGTLQALREQLWGYPWREGALGSGGLLLILGAATLWVRGVRNRWR